MKHRSRLPLANLGLSGILLGTVAQSAHGAEVIQFRYKETIVEISSQELESFSQTGQLPLAIQTFLGSTVQAPERFQSLLTRQIKVPSSVRDFLGSTIGEFALDRLDKVILSTSGKQEQRLTFLKSAFNSAFTAEGFSFIDLVRKYPDATVEVNVTNLESTYNDVVSFIENAKPKLNTAKSFLGNMLCDCDRAQSAESSMASSASKPRSISPNQPCPSPHGTKQRIGTKNAIAPPSL